MIAEKQVRTYSFILFIISPVLGLFLGLKSLDKKGKHFFLILFGLFYGILLNYSQNADAARYVQLVESYYDLGFSEFWNRLIDILLLQPETGMQKDMYI